MPRNIAYIVAMSDSTHLAAFMARRPSLLRRLARLLGSRADAEDLSQEAWIRIATSEISSHPVAFLDHVATNLAIDRRRGMAVRGITGAEGLDHLVCPMPTPERTILDRERVRRTEQAIAAIPRRRRAVFLAVRLEGMSHAAAAARFGISIAAVEKHIARVMAHLVDNAD